MPDTEEQLKGWGLIAGNGRFPFLVLEGARSQGIEMAVIALKEEASPELEKIAKRLHWVSLGELSKTIELLLQEGVTQAVMAGQVKHTKIFAGGLMPDPTFLSVMARLPFRNTDGLIGAVASLLKDNGIDLIDSTSLLKPLIATPGVMTERMPNEEEHKDFAFGYVVADAIAALDVGQTIAVKHRAVVAVEAMEGTDEVIGRAGHLAGPGVRIIKVAKPKQDMRFDVPVVGLATVQAMRIAGASALSVDAGKTLMFDRGVMLASANEAGITIIGRDT
jgi:UDP-2,3-diacylglucosamine hydrolase